MRRRWGECRMLPGAARLLQHLREARVPLAVATSTPRATYAAKLSGPAGAMLESAFQAVICGDEVAAPSSSPPALGTLPSAFLCSK